MEDSEAILFNLSSQRHFPSQKTGYDIYCDCNFGPCFRGKGHVELSAFAEPFNGEGKCTSNAKGPSYNIPIDEEGTNMLTNKKDGLFTINELEVWKVKFK